MLTLYILLTLAISSFNAWSCGRSWVESKLVGGMARFMSWCGATMSAIGFTWVYLIVIALIAGPEGVGKLSAERVEQLMDLGYLAIIVPLIGSGLAITLQSWAAFWRHKDFGNGAIAAWNTYAEVHNIMGAVQHVPSAWTAVGELFESDNDEDSGGALVVMLAVLAIGIGVVTTAIIVRTVSARVQRELAMEAAASRY